ncbi:MAG: leucyl/phenylalanyl-tRNA--protein transferase [Pseudomonadota bacterium]|jgi:leucyl/phenylalanyl-tRNA--protein transferase
MLTVLDGDTPFPPLELAEREPNGLLAVGGDLSVRRLVDAYSRGIFPWYSRGDPILWWSPDPRMVLFPEELRVQRSLRQRLARVDYDVRADTAFDSVVEACAAPRPGQDGTWITRPMREAYARLHAAGIAHCVETWIDGRLAGGLYGIAIGRAFFGESMFTRVPDASKIALVHLVRRLRVAGFGLVDCQMRTDHLARFGAREIPRADFAARLSELIHCGDTQAGDPAGEGADAPWRRAWSNTAGEAAGTQA